MSYKELDDEIDDEGSDKDYERCKEDKLRGLELIIQGAKLMGWNVHLRDAPPDDDLKYLAVSDPTIQIKVVELK